MTRRGMMALACGGVLAALLGGCLGRRARLRYRMTLVMDTPSGPRSGSGVIESGVSIGPAWYPSQGRGRGSFTLGDAPFVRLDDGRMVFALLCTREWLNPIQRTIGSALRTGALAPLPRPSDDDDAVTVFAAARGTQASGIVRDQFPTLVTFARASDPKSVHEIDPLNAATALGPGYALREIRLQIVPDSEPLTTGIRKVLPWLGSGNETPLGDFPSLDGPQPLYAELQHGFFTTSKAA